MPKNVKISRKRKRKDAPVFGRTKAPPSASKSLRATQRDNHAKFRTMLERVVARTKAGRAKLAAEAAGADMSDLDHLPVIVGAHKPPGLNRKGHKHDDDLDMESGPPEPVARPPIAPPVALDREALSQIEVEERERRRPKTPPPTLKQRWLEARWRDATERARTPAPPPPPEPEPVSEERQRVRDAIASNAAKLAAQITDPIVKVHRCGECRQPGHNKRRCDHSMCDPATCTQPWQIPERDPGAVHAAAG